MQLLEKNKRKVIINITSLIDVLFLLLIFFMISSTFIEQPGMKLELPESKSSASEKVEDLTLEIHVGGQLFLNEEEVALENLEQKLTELLPTVVDKSIVLRADKDVTHGIVVKAMDIAKLSGFEKLIIATKIVTE